MKFSGSSKLSSRHEFSVLYRTPVAWIRAPALHDPGLAVMNVMMPQVSDGTRTDIWVSVIRHQTPLHHEGVSDPHRPEHVQHP